METIFRRIQRFYDVFMRTNVPRVYHAKSKECVHNYERDKISNDSRINNIAHTHITTRKKTHT